MAAHHPAHISLMVHVTGPSLNHHCGQGNKIHQLTLAIVWCLHALWLHVILFSLLPTLPQPHGPPSCSSNSPGMLHLRALAIALPSAQSIFPQRSVWLLPTSLDVCTNVTFPTRTPGFELTLIPPAAHSHIPYSYLLSYFSLEQIPSSDCN